MLSFVKVGISISICETIFLLILLLPPDLSIRLAKPIIWAPCFSAIIEHSKLDFPVVITSSTTRILCFFLISNPLRNSKLLFTLSAKIVSTSKRRPISYPITIPPIAGERIRLKS